LELISRIFEYAEDFSTVASFAQTARIFYHTWREYASSICRAVAPRVIWNPVDAERLLDMQEKAEVSKEWQEDREQRSIIRAKRLLANARCASAACNDWVKVCEFNEERNFAHYEWLRGKDPRMRPSELARFERAFYRVWVIGVMGKSKTLEEQARAFLNDCDPQELFRLQELALWSSSYNTGNFGSSGLNLTDEAWETGRTLVYEASKYIIPTAVPDNQDVPLGFFAFFDHTQRYLDYVEKSQ
jgi:hypothetical protein